MTKSKSTTSPTALLLSASRDGDLIAVNKALLGGSDVDARDSKGRTALMLGTIGGNVQVIEMLLDTGANPNLKDKKGRSALRIAIDLKKECEGIDRRDPQASDQARLIIGLLLSKGADPDETDINGFMLTRHLSRTNQFDVANLLVEFGGQGKREAELIKSIEDSCADRVRELLDEGVNPNTRQTNGDTALILAAELGLLDIATDLIEKGADIGATDNDGRTALMHTSSIFHWIQEAKGDGQASMVSLLVTKGADIDATDKAGNTALMLSAPGMCRFDVEIVRALLDHIADVHLSNARGRNALALAVFIEGGNKEIVEALLSNGADPNSALPTDDLDDERDEGAAGYLKGMSVLIWAAMFGRMEVVELLLRAGANVNQTIESGLAALHFAAFGKDSQKDPQKDTQSVKLLVTNGADLKRDGSKAFALAPKNGAIRQYLASCGVDPNLVEGKHLDLAALTQRAEGVLNSAAGRLDRYVTGRARFVRGELPGQGKKR